VSIGDVDGDLASKNFRDAWFHLRFIRAQRHSRQGSPISGACSTGEISIEPAAERTSHNV
jgi:hypothetical protein